MHCLKYLLDVCAVNSTHTEVNEYSAAKKSVLAVTSQHYILYCTSTHSGASLDRFLEPCFRFLAASVACSFLDLCAAVRKSTIHFLIHVHVQVQEKQRKIHSINFK